MKSRYRLSALPRTSGQISITAFLGTTFVASAMLSPAHGQPSQAGSLSEGTPSQSSATTAPLVLDTITVKGKAEPDPADAPYQTPGSSAYISGEQVERFRGTSVGDFLSGIPGVLNADSRNSGAVDVNIRGMQGQGRVPVSVDGATQETTIWQGYNGATPRTYIDPDFISDISIEKGLSSAADATGATGGVVRVSTIGVKDILLPGKRYGIRLKGGFNTNSSPVPSAGTYGGWDHIASTLPYTKELPPAHTRFSADGMSRPPLLTPTGGSGSIAIANTTEMVDIVVAYAQRKNGNYHAGVRGGDGAHLIVDYDDYERPVVGNGGLSSYRAGEEILNTSIDNKSWMLKTTLNFDPTHHLELGYRKYLSDYGHVLSSRLWGMAYQSWLSTIALDTYTARYRWNPEDSNFLNLKVDAFLSAVENRVNVMEISPETDYSDPTHPQIDRYYPYFQWVSSKRMGITASNTSGFISPVGGVSVRYGGAFVYEETGQPRGLDLQYYMWELGGEPTSNGSRQEGSGFVGVDWQPLQWLKAGATTRFSHFVTKDNFHTRTSTYKRHDSGWSSLFSLTIEPEEGLQLYTKYGRMVRAPSIFESLTSPSFYYPIEKNPLKLERAHNFELGVNLSRDNVWLSDDRVRIHAAYFDNHIDDYLTRAGVRRESQNSASGYVEVLGRINLDYAKMRGFEASVAYDTGRYFGSLAWNHYTHIMFCARKGVLLDEEPICRAGGLPHSYSLQQVPPRNTFTLNMGARLLQKKLELGSRVNYVGSRMASGISKNIGVGGMQASNWRPYTLVDIYSKYKLNKHVSFALSIDNLTDRYYMDALNAALMPAPGRTVRGNVTVQF
ncbi:TonB-dependent receptor [Allopusillimonas soli]|uniref:TonB-dependent receptor n=1 Tax=Allopusillimonas soli TaxID=659016 RepID=A0A853F9P5_9BURK|nr:TonB-dependent receptor [Allopusillimonas soli]NYT35321.1 TonB-dependent receptor [Allopusillimonas soli]TEA75743.1 TonB-dependent receptor [Allopusillimonas soli]